MTKKQFAVIWTEEGREEYGVSPSDLIITVVPAEEIKVNINASKRGRPKYRYSEPLAIFDEQEAAEAFRANNTDWVVVPIKMYLPTLY